MMGRVENFDVLRQWAEDPALSIECTRSGKESVLLRRPNDKRSLWHRIMLFFLRLDPEVDRYRKLRNTLKNILKEEHTPEEISSIKRIFEKIRQEFFHLQKVHGNVVSQIQANDLLEAYNLLFSNEQFKSLLPRMRKTQDEKKASSPNPLLLVEYRNIDAFVREVDALKRDGKVLSEEDVQKLLEKNLLKVEDVPYGKMIQLLYRHKFRGRVELEQLITKIAAWQFCSGASVRDVKRKVSFFQKIRAEPWLEVEGEYYSFSELFGYKIRKPKSIQESFTRSLTEKMKAFLLQKSHNFRKAVRRVLKCAQAEIICSTAFSRATFIECPQGSLLSPRSIRGKLLSEALPPQEEIGFAGKASFTLHDLFGGYEPSCPHIKCSSAQQSARAQGALLGAMGSFIDSHDTLLIVQRLSPSDIHHFYATADARVLTRAECAEVLRQELECKDSPEGRLLSELEAFFKEDQAPTINIAGTTMSSVNTLAVGKDPAILATNDRKIMMVRHRDGSLAFHAFVGATSVNSIGVTTPTGDVYLGDDFGAMGYGSESKEQWITAKTGKPAHSPAKMYLSLHKRMIVSVLNFLSALRRKFRGKLFTKRAASEVAFAPGGSTVISLYLKRDYELTLPLQHYQHAAVREGEGREPETIELQCRVGDLFATPVSYQAIQLMKSYGIKISSRRPLQALQQFHEKLLAQDLPTAFEKKWRTILDGAFDGGSSSIAELVSRFSGDDRYMVEGLLKVIRKKRSA